MAGSSRRFRKSTSTGIAASSIIALALGGVSVVAPGPLAPHAAAASSYTGGIRERSGAVEKDAQKASDLPAGSCVVDSTDGKGSQAGFHWNTVEPAAESPDKKRWGLSVAFDNSKDRTFADWGFTHSGRMGGYLDRGQVPSMKAGETFLQGEVVTHAADEKIRIDGSGQQRNLNLFAELTDAKVKQFAEATDGNPVRYAWQGYYTQENPGANRATRGASFSALVNPWPSENIECNPITVTWESKEKLVIRKGEELKVGKINIPAVTGGGTDDSMSRMVVEAYDAQGNFIGTSDTVASGGGTSSVRIDQETGEIFYTMPEYKGTNLSAQQGMRFNVLAKPRTVTQLQDAAKSNNEYLGHDGAFESSNSLTRYNKPNFIDKHQWSFDDTQFHDPKYDPDQQAIISGVEDNKPTKERQVVSFKEAGDKITDLVKKREDGGFEAEVKLDKKNVYSGWDAKMDPKTYEVTVTAPSNPAPGTFAQPRVIVTYSNGSQDIIPLLVTVDHNHTQVSELKLETPGTTKGVPGQDIEAQLTVGKVIDDYGPFTPTSYEVVGGVPEGWTVTVDENGKVTAKSPKDAPNFSTITPKIRATYPDGTIDEVDVSFQVVNNVKVPDYTAVSGKAEEEVKLQPVMPPVGLGGKETDEEPNRYTFEDGTTEYKVGDWTVTIDENTGELTSTIPKSALPGAQLTVPVKVYYPSGANPQIATGTISVIGDGSGEDNAFYRPQLTKAGESVKSDITTLLDDPKKATYKLPPKKQWPADWEFSIDESGTVTATPGENVPNGATVTIPVEVTYPDGSKASVPADFTVVDAYARANQPSYPTVTGDIGTTVTSKVDRTYLDDNAEPRFSLVTDPKDPDYIAPPRNLTWDQVKIDPVTGEITTPIGANVLPGSSADIPVRVTYKDGSRDFTIATVVAKGKHRQIYEPKYELKTTKPGVEKASPILDDTKVPERDLAEDKSKRFSAPGTVEGWTVKVDESGIVTATPPADAKAGDGIQVPVEVTYLDGSQETVFAPFKVIEEQKDVNEPYYSVEVTGPGVKVDRPIKPNNIPAGSKFAFGVDGDNPITKTTVDGWDYEINPDTGEISVTPPANAKPGDKHDYKITVTYPDGSVDDVPVSTIVKLTNNWESEPVIPSQTVYPGGTATSPIGVEKPAEINLHPDTPYTINPKGKGLEATGEKNEFGNPTYKVKTANGDWLVGLDDKGNVISTAPATAKAGDKIDVPVIVTYEDGSKDNAKAVVNVEDVLTREVPFKVEYKYSDEIPAGEYKVETKGELGEEKLNGETREWDRTKDPVNEVIVIGTKPSESSKKVEWKAPVPFEVETRPNPALKPGEIKVVQTGVPGEKTYTADFTSKGDEATVKPEEKQTKAPVNQIIEYGPTLEDQTLTSTKTREVAFETEFIVDNTVPVGQTKIEQEGENGEELITSTQKVENGKPVGEPTITIEETKAPKKQIVRVGSMTDGTYELEEKLPIPFDSRIEYDPEIPAGEYKVVTEGKPGEQITKITQKIENSKVVEATRGETTSTEPVTKVIKVGTKQATASDKVEWKEPIPYPTELHANPDLAPGEVRVVQEGKDGEATYTASFTGTSGEAAKTEQSSRTEPTPRIVEYGPGLEDNELVSKTTRSVDFETKVIEDPNLEEGKQVVEHGEFGEEVVTTTQKLVSGKPSGDPVVKTERTKEPKDAVIRIGTKKVEQPTPPTDEPEQPTPPTTPPTDEPEQPTPPTTPPTDEPTPPTDEPDQPEDPTPGPSLPPKEVELPFTTRIIYDETLKPGEEIVEQEGENGKVEVTVENGEPSVKTTKEPIQRIVRVGTKPADSVEWNERIPFDVKVKLDPTLEAGQHKVEQEGKPGLVHHKADGSEETLIEKQDHVILIGTKKPEGEPEDPTPVPEGGIEIDVRYTTRVVFDPNLEPGEEVEDVAGKDGKYVIKVVDGKPVAELVEQPVERVVRVGSKPPKGTSWTEELAYDYEVVEDPNLESGKHEVVQPGKPGERIHREDGSVVEVPAQKLIIKVGTKKTEPTEPNVPADPQDPSKSSSEKAKRCVANAFAANSPILWLLPIGLLAGVGYGVNEAFGPQIQQAVGQLNRRVQDSLPDNSFGRGGHGHNFEQPEWMRELQAQANAVNRQFAGYGEQLQPLGIALGAIAALSLTGVLIAQACREEGFDNGLTVLGSSAEGKTSSEKEGSSEQK